MSGILKLWDAEHGTTRLSITGPVGNLQLALNCQLAVSGDIHDSRLVPAFYETVVCRSHQAHAKYC